MRITYPLIIFLILAATVPCAYAAPTTGAATGVTSINMTFVATGATTPTWWLYGTNSSNLVWRTVNVSAGSGLANYTQTGLPLMANTQFYFRACDTTGCGATLSATMLQVTAAPEPTFGNTVQNISAARLDPKQIAGATTEPYIWVTGTPLILFGVLLFFVFTGLWLRQRETILPTILGMIGSGMIMYQGTNSVGVPPEFLIIAIGLVAVALTGIIVGILKR